MRYSNAVKDPEWPNEEAPTLTHQSGDVVILPDLFVEAATLDGETTRIELGMEPVVVGKSADCDLVIDDPCCPVTTAHSASRRAVWWFAIWQARTARPSTVFGSSRPPCRWGARFRCSSPPPSGAPRDIDRLLALPLREAREMVVEGFERSYLQSKLDEHGGNMTRTAESVGVSRQFLHRLVERHGLRGDGR